MASAVAFSFHISCSSFPFFSWSVARSCSSASTCTARKLVPSAVHPLSLATEYQMHECIEQKQKDFYSYSRRQIATASILAAFSLVVAVGAGDAQARDIPIFGIRRVQKVEEEVVKEVKELVKEGVSETMASVEAVEEAVKESVANLSSLSSSKPAAAKEAALSPALQAGIVAGAEVAAFLVASSVVDNLVTKPSK